VWRELTSSAVIVIVLAAGISCSGQSENHIDLSTRESILTGAAYRIVDLRVTGGSSSSHWASDSSSMTIDYDAWPVEMQSQLVRVQSNLLLPPNGRCVASFHGVSSSGRPWSQSFDGSPGHAALSIGHRYIAVGGPASFVPESYQIEYAYAVDDATSTLAEPALGFPRGTPVSAVFDASTLGSIGFAFAYSCTGGSCTQSSMVAGSNSDASLDL
jgi:hypothetical protein